MDTLRGNFASLANYGDEEQDYDPTEDDATRETPPSPIGQDERRMQVRAYNHWANLLTDRNFPLIEDLEPENLPDFGPYSVLLDFSGGIENPGIVFLGDQLAGECGTDEGISCLDDVPSRSLLSRITDHYMQILANQAPIGFEAEFVNQQARTILYRGILLPFSSDDDTIDFIYGVINWKELADQFTTDELMLEIDQALDETAPVIEATPDDNTMADWADSPLAEKPVGAGKSRSILDLSPAMAEDNDAESDLPSPGFGIDLTSDLATDLAETKPSQDWPADVQAGPEPELKAPDEGDMQLGDLLASARELAQAANNSEDRTRHALYAAIGRAYDFSIVANDEPEEFSDLLMDSGLTVQDRAPMTPIVKLVFGADYDKTRLTEYAAALSHGHRLGIGRGDLTTFLSSAEGGLKGVVKAERRLRREENGKPAINAGAPNERTARKLRKLEPQSLDAINAEGQEFALVMIRRMPDGEVALLGELPEDLPMLERAARKLLD